MPEFHSEPYLHLAGLSHKSALVTWGAFYFKTRTHRFPIGSGGQDREWKLVEDHDLRYVHPPRRESIGARSAPYGPARVNVFDTNGALAATSFTETCNFCWVSGLEPDTRYRYEVIVKDEAWGEGERWDWTPGDRQGLVQRGGRYVNEFLTHPDPAREPSGSFTFIGAVVAEQRASGDPRRSAGTREVAVDADGLRSARRAADHYGGRQHLRRDEDTRPPDRLEHRRRGRRLVLHVLPAVPVHDQPGRRVPVHRQPRHGGDRGSRRPGAAARQHVPPGADCERRGVRPGVGRPGLVLPVPLRPRRGVHASTRRRKASSATSACSSIQSTGSGSSRRSRPDRTSAGGSRSATIRRSARGLAITTPTTWRCCSRSFAQGAARVVFSGHEHNFQHSHHAGIDYFVTGAGSKVRKGTPDDFAGAHTLSWADEAHFLLVTIAGGTMTVRPIGEAVGGVPQDLERRLPDGTPLRGPIVIAR